MNTRNIVLIIVVLIFNCVKAQKVYVPDDNFEQKLISLGYDDVLDDSVSVYSVDTIKVLDIQQLYIEDLTGIESFTFLERLNCSSNLLTTLDVSQNIYMQELSCNYNQLTTLNTSNNVNLIRLFSHGNELTDINVSNNYNLEYLKLDNNQLSNLNVSNNVYLKSLSCYYNNISEINLLNNSDLKFLALSHCNLYELDLSNNTHLESLGLDMTKLTSLDLTNNIHLKYILFQNNLDLISVNLANSYNDSIESLYIYDSPELICVQVDDVNADLNNWDFAQVNPNFTLSEDCASLIGVEEEKEQAVEVFPNPTTGLLNINIKETGMYELYSVLGQTAIQSGHFNAGDNQINLSRLDLGVYMLKVINTQGDVQLKRIIKH